MQKGRDDVPTKGHASIVFRAITEPHLLDPEEVEELVKVVFRKAIHNEDSAEPAARFCARLITDEFDGGFGNELLWTCHDWLKQHGFPVPRSTVRVPGEPQAQEIAGQELASFLKFIASFLSDLPEISGAPSVGSLRCGHVFRISALLCDGCKLVMHSPHLDYEAKVACIHAALTTAGKAAERGAPARMAALVSCLRDAFLWPDVPEEARGTLLELIELRASGWKQPRSRSSPTPASKTPPETQTCHLCHAAPPNKTALQLSPEEKKMARFFNFFEMMDRYILFLYGKNK